MGWGCLARYDWKTRPEGGEKDERDKQCKLQGTPQEATRWPGGQVDGRHNGGRAEANRSEVTVGQTGPSKGICTQARAGINCNPENKNRNGMIRNRL